MSKFAHYIEIPLNILQWILDKPYLVFGIIITLLIIRTLLKHGKVINAIIDKQTIEIKKQLREANST